MTRGGRRVGAGRKPAAGVRRTVDLHILASEAEAAEIQAACEARGRSLSDVARELLLRWARRMEPRRRSQPAVQRLTRAEILARADAIARDLLGTTRQDAFAQLERGELSGTLAEPELRMLRGMLGKAQ